MDSKFIELVASVLEIAPDSLNEQSNTENTPEWDSLLHWELISEIESTYNIKFTMAEAADFKNLGEIYTALQNKLS